jgi:hypothetical protein
LYSDLPKYLPLYTAVLRRKLKGGLTGIVSLRIYIKLACLLFSEFMDLSKNRAIDALTETSLLGEVFARIMKIY